MATFRRTLVLALSAALLVAGGLGWYFYLHYSDPETVRRLVLEWARNACPKATVELDSAQASLWSGVRLRNIRLCGKDDRECGDVFTLEDVSIVPDRASLLEGKLRADRIVLHRPTIRLHHFSDGTWNLSRLLTGKQIRFPHATEIVVDGASVHVSFDDAISPPVAVDDVHGRIHLESPAIATWELTGRHAVSKDIQSTGRADLVENEIRVDAETRSPVDLAHVQIHLPEDLRVRMSELRDLSGFVHLRAAATGRKSATGWDWDASLGGALDQVSLHHDKLPYPIRDARGAFRATRDGLSLQDVEFLVGTSKATVHARVTSWDPRQWEASGVVRNLELTPAVRKVLFDNGKKVWDKFHPSGFVDVQGRVVQDGDSLRVAGHVDLRDGAFRFEHFAYPVDEVAGRATLSEDGGVRLALTGRAKSAEVEISGAMANLKPGSQSEFLVRATGMILDEDLLRALPPGPAQVVRDMRPGTTTGDVVSRVTRDAGSAKFHHETEIDVRSSEASYVGFPYRVENITGHVSVAPQRTQFRDFVGTADGATIRLRGQAYTQTDGVHFEIGVVGESVPLDNKLASAMPLHWQTSWAKLHASGRADVACNIVRSPGEELFLELEADPSAASIEPESFPYRIDSFQGRVTYRNKVIAWEPMSFKHGAVNLSCSGSLALTADGGVLDVRELVSNNLVYDESLRRAAPLSLRKTLEFLQPTKPVGVRFPRIRVAWADGPKRNWEIALDGGIALQNASLLDGESIQGATGVLWYRGQCVNDHPMFTGNIDFSTIEVHGFRATGVRSSIRVDGDTFEMPNIRGDMYGGQMHGSIRAGRGAESAHECRFNLYGARLREYAKTHFSGSSSIDGLVYLDLFLEGAGEDAHRLKGRGKLDVLEADIDRLPILQDLFRIGNLQPPTGKAFEEVNGNFRIDDNRVLIEKLELLGPANIVGPSFSLISDGEGTLRMDSRDVDLMLSARWGRGRFRIPVLTPSFNLANDQVWSFHVHGRLDDPIITPAPLKGFLRMLERPRDNARRLERGPEALPAGLRGASR